MGKKRVVQESGQSEVTVLMFKLRGSDATVQEGINTIAEAMTQMVPPPTRTQRPALAADPVEQRLHSSDDDDVTEIEDDVVLVKAAAARRTPKSPEILDLDLAGDGVSLEDFLNKHAGEQVNKRYLFISFWLKKHLIIESVTKDHIHTCFRHMGWQTPKDAAQPLRDMKSKLGWYHKGERRGTYMINHVGENVVLKEIRTES